ncbi:SulP family inorganic anion transporter [Solicola gregarius]|uniref:SulP family inorganic anion transporter n=1 Tax=Solicola gregarius TaxID=2908642 RepID=A0AA46TGY7_9ACTN|nr:SulP family inorganic anion transporter [Solicola gregarius]UYM04998.1 SulP family inorganic anion transporter [Solicola gregarius]
MRDIDRAKLKADTSAGVVLGVESVPDGLASGILAGVNPLAGLYAYLFGMVGAAAFTSSALMAVQSTGAMALIVADTDLAARDDPDRALFTLAVLTGVVMIVAGLVRGGALLRFVPTAVMTGFVTAVGINIVLGQLSNFTGYDAPGANRVLRAVNLVLHPWRVDGWTVVVGAVSIVLIVLLRRTRLRSLGLVVAIIIGSALAAVIDAAGGSIALVGDLADLPRALPAPRLPVPSEALALLLPALSLAFVGLVQGAAVSSGVPNPDGRPADASRDFIGQGAGNVVAGLFQGMPVGGSMSASGLAQSAGARSRMALFAAGVVMAVVIVALGGVVGHVAMPALAALLIVVGIATIKPSQVMSVVRTGPLQTTVLVVTLVMTLVIPLQYAVLAGVGLAIVLHVAEQSNRVALRQIEVAPDGRLHESEPPGMLEAASVVVLQPYGSLFFASAPVLRGQLPVVTGRSRPAVVVIRLRGVDQLGLSIIDVLRQYGRALQAHGCVLKLIVASDRVLHQLRTERVLGELGEDNVYRGTEWLGDAVRRAHADATDELASFGPDPGTEKGH